MYSGCTGSVRFSPVQYIWHWGLGGLQGDKVLVRGLELQLSEQQIHDMMGRRDGDGGRALVQRTLRDHIRSITGAAFDTPFFIRPRHSRRALWLLHLSRHPTARDVMMQCHWNVRNTFEHYGTGGFDMLGWDPLREPGGPTLFNFKEIDEQNMRKDLMGTMPEQLFGLAADHPITIDRVHHVLANRTAARFSDLDQIIMRLFQEKEFDILTPEGKPRTRALQRLRVTDRVAFPDTLLLPSLSRISRSQRPR